MRRLVPVAAAVLLPLSVASFAETKQPVHAVPPPPPSLEDKGIYAEPATTGYPTDGAIVDPAPDAIPEQGMAPDKPDTRLVRDKAARDQAALRERIAASELTVRSEGRDTVEEYRQNGKVWMIKIVPPDGPNRIYMDNTGTGRLSRDPKMGPIDPVYFTIYEWN